MSSLMELELDSIVWGSRIIESVYKIYIYILTGLSQQLLNLGAQIFALSGQLNDALFVFGQLRFFGQTVLGQGRVFVENGLLLGFQLCQL